MPDSQKFPFLQNIGERFLLDPMPYLPLTLEREGQRKQVFGLLDTGSTVCVLPYRVGLELGAVWEEQTIPLRLKGNLANFEARALLLTAQIGEFAPVNLAFAWTSAEDAPLVLGQTNFFMEFDVCFFRSQNEFEIKSK